MDEQRVCWDCIGDKVLGAEIRAEGIIGSCSFCNAPEPRPTKTIDELAPRIGEKFREEYRPGEMVPKFSSTSDHFSEEQEGETPNWRIQEMLGCDVDVAEAVVDWLRENDDADPTDGGTPWFDGELLFMPSDPSDEPWQLWQHFVWSSKHQRRFLDADLKAMLDELFGDIMPFVQPAPDGLFSKPEEAVQSPFFTVNPGDELSVVFRGRLVKSAEEAEEFAQNAGRELGPPPSSSATPGRMNAAGISVFYGAFSLEACVAEVRPRIGGLVAIGRFRMIRPLRLLDFTTFQKHFLRESVFAPDHARRQGILHFLKQIGDIIASPVQPHEELTDYIPTQILGEYLRARYDIDGLIYPPAQMAFPQDDSDEATRRKRSNAVIFHHAARVEGGHTLDDLRRDLKDPREVFLTLDLQVRDPSDRAVYIASISDVVIKFYIELLRRYDQDSRIVF